MFPLKDVGGRPGSWHGQNRPAPINPDKSENFKIYSNFARLSPASKASALASLLNLIRLSGGAWPGMTGTAIASTVSLIGIKRFWRGFQARARSQEDKGFLKTRKSLEATTDSQRLLKNPTFSNLLVRSGNEWLTFATQFIPNVPANKTKIFWMFKAQTLA
jgi:hypothetical protein